VREREDEGKIPKFFWVCGILLVIQHMESFFWITSSSRKILPTYHTFMKRLSLATCVLALSAGYALAQERVAVFTETSGKEETCQVNYTTNLKAPTLATKRTAQAKFLFRQMPTLENGGTFQQSEIVLHIEGKKKHFSFKSSSPGDTRTIARLDLKPTTYELALPKNPLGTQYEVAGDANLVASPEDPIARSSTELILGNRRVVQLPPSGLGFIMPTSLKGEGQSWSFTKVNVVATPIIPAHTSSTMCRASWVRLLKFDKDISDLSNSGPPLTEPDALGVEREAYFNKSIPYSAKLVLGVLNRLGYSPLPTTP
jgi:hypothetical protein